MKPTPKKKISPVKTIREVALLGILIALIYLLLSPGDDRSFTPVTLADLQGVWTTNAPRHKDRFLQFGDNTVTFGWGEAKAGTYVVDNLESEATENGTLVEVRYLDMAATEYRLGFYYDALGSGMIRMKRQKGLVWVRVSDQATHEPQFK